MVALVSLCGVLWEACATVTLKSLKPVEEQRSAFRDLERNKVVVTSFVVYNVWLVVVSLYLTIKLFLQHWSDS